MRILRHNRRAALLIAAGAALAVLAALMLLNRSHDDSGDQGGSVIGTPGPGTSGTDILTPTSPARKGAKAKPGKSAAGTGTGRADAFDIAGLPGHTLEAELPVIRIQLTLQSAAPIGTVGYVIPTSRAHPSGTIKGVGTSWTLSTTGYGRPDYARIFFGAGPAGTPITCTITIDGKVTEHRSTTGPYGRMMCQG